MENNIFSRDQFSKVLVNTDKSALEAYKARREQSLKVESISNDINTLKVEFEEIKFLLRQLITKKE